MTTSLSTSDKKLLKSGLKMKKLKGVKKLKAAIKKVVAKKKAQKAAAYASSALAKRVTKKALKKAKKQDIWTSWRKYPFGKKGPALKKINPKGFKAADKKCAAIRTLAARKCAQHFCKARKTCGIPCVDRILQPPRMVIPLYRNPHDKNSPLWHKTAEVTHKEGRAKEQKHKELTYKSDVLKRQVAKERHAKELEAKEGVAKEKASKVVAVKEKNTKVKAAGVLAAKVKEDTNKFAAHKEKTSKACKKEGDTVLSKCNTAENKAKKATQ